MLIRLTRRQYEKMSKREISELLAVGYHLQVKG